MKHASVTILKCRIKGEGRLTYRVRSFPREEDRLVALALRFAIAPFLLHFLRIKPFGYQRGGD